MTFPVVIEKPAKLEPTAPDTFIEVDASAVDRSASWPWPSRRPADA